jgi:hypothetical protein
MFLSLLWCNVSVAQISWKKIPVPQDFLDLGYENNETEKSVGEIFLECAKGNNSIYISVNFDNKKIGWSRDGPPSDLEYDIYLITDNLIKGIASSNATKYQIEARQYTDGYVVIEVPIIEVNRITGHYKIDFDKHDLTQKNELGNYMLDGFWVVVTPKATCKVIKTEKKF